MHGRAWSRHRVGVLWGLVFLGAGILAAELFRRHPAAEPYVPGLLLPAVLWFVHCFGLPGGFPALVVACGYAALSAQNPGSPGGWIWISSFVVCAISGSLARPRRTGAARSAPPPRSAEDDSEVIVLTDPEGWVRKWNRPAIRLTDWPAEDIVGTRRFEDLLPPTHRRPYRDAARETLTGDAAPLGRRVELGLLHANGKEFPAAVVLSRVEFGDGVWLNHVVIDLTEDRRAEEEARQAHRMEAVGRLAGGIAHDFNNILTAILGYGDLLRKELAAQPALLSYADEVMKAGELAKSLTDQLLSFSRRQVIEPRVVDLNATVERVEGLLRRLLGESVRLTTSLDARPARVKADPGQLGQVIMNLAINARDAMPAGGDLTLRTNNITLSKAEASRYQDASPGDHVLLEVADTGAGMDDETRSHLFEPFFTTKGPGKGTGLGLATVYGIVKQSGGHIRVQSGLGKGSCFRVYLPRTEETASPSTRVPPTALEPGNAIVLLVEDSDVVRKLAREVLRHQGYRVLEACDGTEALKVAAEFSGEIQLLITDLVMPHLGGHELSIKLRKDRPETKVLYVSGYADTAFLTREFLESRPAFLHKPFTPDLLLRKVASVLGRTPSGRFQSVGERA